MSNIPPSVTREDLGRIVRRVLVDWALEQPEAESHPSWLLTWSELDDAQREADMRIGAAVWERCARSAGALVERWQADITRLRSAGANEIDRAVARRLDTCANEIDNLLRPVQL